MKYTDYGYPSFYVHHLDVYSVLEHSETVNVADVFVKVCDECPEGSHHHGQWDTSGVCYCDHGDMPVPGGDVSQCPQSCKLVPIEAHECLEKGPWKKLASAASQGASSTWVDYGADDFPDCSEVGDGTPSGTRCEHDGEEENLLDNCMDFDYNYFYDRYNGPGGDGFADIFEWRCEAECEDHEDELRDMLDQVNEDKDYDYSGDNGIYDCKSMRRFLEYRTDGNTCTLPLNDVINNIFWSNVEYSMKGLESICGCTCKRERSMCALDVDSYIAMDGQCDDGDRPFNNGCFEVSCIYS
eukprot:UN29497